MKFFRNLFLGGFIAALPARAIYAPIPEQDSSKDLIVSIRAGVSYDTNLFGAATGAIESAIFTLAPRISYSASLGSQTFLGTSYGFTLDQFDNRPGDKLLDSHDASVRFAHAFSKESNIDINEAFTIARNPESLLAGTRLNSDQSFKRNQLDSRYLVPLSPKINATLKARSIYYKYRDATLGRSIDRIENLYGVAGDYTVLPELKGVAEYRHQDVYYRKEGEIKNKTSDYLMGGADYEAARKLTISARLGVEWRDRKAERDTTSPYGEVSGKYDYAEGSYLVGGYIYTLEESSDTARFTDTRVNRLFVNVQHRFTALIVGSGSITYEPSQLQGRRGVADVDENTVRVGGALSYLPTKNWTITASYDFDRVNSDDTARRLRRERVGVNASYTF